MASAVKRLAFAILLAGCGQAFTSIAGDGGSGMQTSPSLIDGSAEGGGDGGALDGTVMDAAADAPPPDASADAAGDGPSSPPPGDGASDGPACGCPSGFACIAARCEDHAALHFSATANPSLNWSYGSASSLGNAFVAFPTHWTPATVPGLTLWSSLANTYIPSVFHNGGITTASYATLQVLPGQLGFWPGSTGGIAIVRWTPPVAGSYGITVLFTGASFAADGGAEATVGVGVRLTGQVIVSAQTIGTNGSGNFASYSAPPALKGLTDFIEFYVDYGTNSSSVADGTVLDAVISSN